MSRFLQLFRRRLVNRLRYFGGNKWYTYLLYALGEIALVVIGILIAIQIDGMNEARRLKKVEINSLSEILSGLEKSREDVIRCLEQDKRWRACSYKILEYLDQAKPYDTSLDQCFGCYYWSPTVQLTTSAYDQLKIRGLELISNDRLRNEITEMFDSKFDVLKSEIELWDSQLLSSTIYPLHITLFRKYYPPSWEVYQDEFAKPIDYDSLIKNDAYKNLLAEIISLRNYSIQTNEALERDLQTLMDNIEQELKALRKEGG